MNIELILDEEKRSFFDNLKSDKNALVVPLDKWKAFIQDNLVSNNYRDPDFRIAGDYVITELNAFASFVGNIRGLFYGRTEGYVTKDYGAFRFAGKLELKKVMPPAPNHDIFNVGLRQPGSFRSK